MELIRMVANRSPWLHQNFPHFMLTIININLKWLLQIRECQNKCVVDLLLQKIKWSLLLLSTLKYFPLPSCNVKQRWSNIRKISYKISKILNKYYKTPYFNHIIEPCPLRNGYNHFNIYLKFPSTNGMSYIHQIFLTKLTLTPF